MWALNMALIHAGKLLRTRPTNPFSSWKNATGTADYTKSNIPVHKIFDNFLPKKL
jgi:hypothetical protein